MLIGLFACGLLLSPIHAKAKAPSPQQAVDEILHLAQAPFDETMNELITQYFTLRLPEGRKPTQAYLFNSQRVQLWGNVISEFNQLMRLLLSFKTLDYQQLVQKRFDAALLIIECFRQEINQLVKTHHPGIALHSSTLRREASGKGVVIAVFDVFDELLLKKQAAHYKHAQILPLKRFGNPVSMTHGNAVIDVILAVSPEVTLLPVSSDDERTNEAMSYLSRNKKIHIVNMSRAFKEQDARLDPEFASLLNAILAKKIVSKSLGNTGTDLDGHITPLRQAQGLPATGNLFAYDLKLIKQFSRENNSLNNLFFAINMNLLKDNSALSATIPGARHAVRQHSVCVPAEGVYAWSSDNYESGSSFAAPQLSAISALLWQIAKHSRTIHPASSISRALKETSRLPQGLPSYLCGLGQIKGDKAYHLLKIANIIDT